MGHGGRLVGTSRVVVTGAWVVNRVFLGAVGLGFVLSWVMGGVFAWWVGQIGPGGDVASKMAGVRLLLLVGVVMGGATEGLLSALRAVVETARLGDPFVAANARRLQTIGWCLLVLQVLDVPAWLAGRLFPALGTGAPGLDVSVGGWVAVLMVFVLSRVFAAGAVMRDEIAATV